MLLSQGIRELVIGVVILIMYIIHWIIYKKSRIEFRKGLAATMIGGGIGTAFYSLLDYWSNGVWNLRLLIPILFFCVVGIILTVLSRKKIVTK